MAKKDGLTSKQLMKRSESKKKMASEQDYLGKAQIKNKVKPGSMMYEGSVLPVGKERLQIAKDMRKQASKDSLDSINMSSGRTAKSGAKGAASVASKKKKR